MNELNRIYPVFLENAGCTERCSFCDQRKSSLGHDLSPQALSRHIEQSLPERGEGELAYYGGSFTRLPVERQKFMLALGKDMVRAGRIHGVRVSTRPDAMCAESVALLQAHGVTTVELGCQSFSMEVLERCGRKYPEGCVADAVARLRGAGIRVGLQLMPGLPGGGVEEAHASLAEALALNPDFLRFYPAVVLRGTQLEQMYLRQGYRPWSLARTVRTGSALVRRAHAASVPVARFGLQASPELAANVVAGPYHAALGQLVRGRIWFEALGASGARGERIYVHRHDLSDAQGYKRRNRRFLRCRNGLEIAVDERVPRGYYVHRETAYKVSGLNPEGVGEHVGI